MFAISYLSILLIPLLTATSVSGRSASHVDELETSKGFDRNTPVFWDVANDERTTQWNSSIFTGTPHGCVVALYFSVITDRLTSANSSDWDFYWKWQLESRWWVPDSITPWCLDGDPVSPILEGPLAYPDDSLVYKYTRAGPNDDGVVIILSGLSQPDSKGKSTVGNAEMYYRNDQTRHGLETKGLR